MFYLEGNVYFYGFSLDRSYVHEEWLEILCKDGKVQTMFERKTYENLITNINIYPKFARANSKDRKLAEALTESMKKQASQLFLYKLNDNGVSKAEKICDWFANIKIIYPKSKFVGLPIIIQTHDDFRKFLSDSLKALDTGINDISIKTTEEMSLTKFAERFRISDEGINMIENAQNGFLEANGRYFKFEEGQKNNIKLMQVKFEHFINGKSVEFNMEDESDGTQRVIHLLPILFKNESNKHSIYIVDELDRSLHNKLSKYIVSNFIDLQYSNQLLFTTHDLNLLDSDLLLQEEIWFIDKNSNGETRLYPLSDFEISNEQNVLIDYLAGRFGAIPYIREG